MKAKEKIDRSVIEAALKRAARNAVIGSREVRSGKLLVTDRDASSNRAAPSKSGRRKT